MFQSVAIYIQSHVSYADLNSPDPDAPAPTGPTPRSRDGGRAAAGVGPWSASPTGPTGRVKVPGVQTAKRLEQSASRSLQRWVELKGASFGKVMWNLGAFSSRWNS